MTIINRYLKYSPEITLEIFTLIWDALIKLGFTKLFSNSQSTEFNAFKDEHNFLIIDEDFKFDTYLSTCLNPDSTPITIKEILGYNPFIKDDFVLPEKWCIYRNDDNYEEINRWASSNPDESFNNKTGRVYWTGLEATTSELNNNVSNPEITFEQFKKYVLKEPIETIKEIIPEYVECIGLREIEIKNWSNHFEIGKIYERTNSNSNNYLIDDFYCDKSQFKPSTKKAFDAQNKQKPIEKWSVGSYVVFLEDNLQANTKKIGNVSQIARYEDDSISFRGGCINNIDGPFSVADKLKWFATKSKAEEFAKTLVKPVKEKVKTPQLDLDEWLDKYKKLNLAVNDLANAIELANFDKVFLKLEGTNSKEKANILYDLWNPKQPLKQAVHCKTQEEWDFVTEKLNYKWNNETGTNNTWSNYGNKTFINLSEKHFNSIESKNYNFQILSFQEWCDLNGYKMENEVKFEVGKWYKILWKWNNSYYYAKFKGFYDNSYKWTEWVKLPNDKLDRDNSFVKEELGIYSEATLEEIQQYLPDNHPDKLPLKAKKVILDESYIGKLVSLTYGGEFYDKVLVTKEGDDIYLLNNCHSNNNSHSDKSIYSYSLKFYGFHIANDKCSNIKLIEETIELISNKEFKAGDWVIVIKSESRFSDINKAIGYVFQIRRDGAYYKGFINGNDEAIDADKKYCINYNKSNVRHATQEEINNHLISIGQIPKDIESYLIRDRSTDDLSNYGLPTEPPSYMYEMYSQSKSNLLLSIDDEELPMVNIIKTNVIKQLLNND